MPKGVPGYMAFLDPDMLEYDALAKELNELDGVSSYYRESAKDTITMVYGGGFPRAIALERDEAERRRDFLRKIKGLPPKEETKNPPKRHPWHKMDRAL